MSRNGAGTFSVINPTRVGSLRSSANTNENFTDAGDELTNTMPLNGVAAMTGQFLADDGTQSAPGISWSQDTNTGFRRSNLDTMIWVAGGSDRATMDSNGKLSLGAGLSVAGAFSKASGTFEPQTLAGTGSARAVLRNTTNDANEHVIASYQSGSGSGATGELRMVGGGANDVATMRFYVNGSLIYQWTSTAFTYSTDVAFGSAGLRADADGFLDYPEITAPNTPAANVARVYARDLSGLTALFYKDGSGSEKQFQPPTSSQVFTSSGTWTAPTAGQTQALIEVWGAGGGGGKNNSSNGGGGGGGGAYSRRVIALASLSSSVTVTIGSGGSGRSSTASGGDGGTSSFGAYLAAYGGGGGFGTSANNTAGGGGGGLTSAGAAGGTLSIGNVSDGGGPNGLLGSEIWGDGLDFADSDGNSNAFGGGAGEFGDGAAAHAAVFGGGGGGSGADDDAAGDGGASIFGGGGGGGATDGPTSGTGGTSMYSGAGGAGGSTGTDGTAPSGGGGGSASGNSGSGGRGQVRITCW